MVQFRRYFIFIIVLSAVFGCNEETDRQLKEDPDSASSTRSAQKVQKVETSFTPGSADSGKDHSKSYGYTISLASDDESVYVYYSEKNKFPVKQERFFLLNKNECLLLRENQFANLSVFASKGKVNVFGSGEKDIPAKTLMIKSDDYMPLCSSNFFQCEADNYVITLREQTGIKNMFMHWDQQFVILPVKVDGLKNKCDYSYRIDNWMHFKVEQYALSRGEGQGKPDPSLKAQIGEWMSNKEITY